jgi:transposase-like protein
LGYFFLISFSDFRGNLASACLAGCRRGKKPPELLAWIAKSRLKQGKKSLEIARFGNLVKPKGDFSGFSDSLLDVYRCKNCRGIYNLYSGTVFAGRHFTPEQTILFLREVLQGKSSAKLARELRISRTTALEVRHLLQANAESEQTTEPLSDLEAMH